MDAAPAAGAKYSNTPLVFSGKVVELGSKPVVEFQVGGISGNWTSVSVGNATSPYTFSASVPFSVIGTNVVNFRARDVAGNISTVVSRSVKYAPTGTLTVAKPLAADGTITAGFAPSSVREIGGNYTIVATPKPGKIFKEWLKDSVSFSRNASLTFAFTGNTTLEPVFVADPYPALVGTFNGLVGTGVETDATAFLANNGFLTLTTTATGGFTGSLRIQGQTLALSGKFDGFGESKLSLKRTDKNPNVLVELALNLTAPGSLSGNVTAGGSALSFTALPGVFKGTKQSSHPFATRKYTVLLPAPVATPIGHGYLTFGIAADGTASVVGKLADGTPVTAGARTVSKDSDNWEIPVHVPAYTGLTGVLWGGLDLPKVPVALQAEVVGDLVWLKPTDPKVKIGTPFLKSLSPVGTRYALTTGQSLLSGNATAAPFSLTVDPSAVALPAFISQNGTWPKTNIPAFPTLAVQNPKSLKITLDAASGKLTGSFNSASAAPAVTSNYEGVVFAYPLTLDATLVRGGGFFTITKGTTGGPFQLTTGP